MATLMLENGARVTGLDDIVYKVRVKNSDNQKGKVVVIA
jgi:hypothetical protein